MKRPFLLLALLAAVALAAVGCKDATLEPDLTGTITGTVFDADTNEPLARAQITTSPPTSAPLTNENGTFRLEDVATGNYTVTASRPGYQSSSVTIAVTENQAAPASLFLEEETADTTDESASLNAQITNWATRIEGDSAFVDVEYRVRNTSDVDVAQYEVDFRIETSSETFFAQETGEDLLAGESDVGSFEKYTRGEEAQDVTIDSVTFEEDTDDDGSS